MRRHLKLFLGERVVLAVFLRLALSVGAGVGIGIAERDWVCLGVVKRLVGEAAIAAEVAAHGERASAVDKLLDRKV